MNPKIIATDYKRAVAELREALGSNPTSRLEQAGCIQYFEFCFELAWKSLKSLASYHGLSDAESPRSALRVAFAQCWLDDEPTWLEMLECRNRMSHTYSSESALDVFRRLNDFADVLQQLDHKLGEILARS
jgi:nucleotidyltransferase substrate binding protein (TIGR01987 family)